MGEVYIDLRKTRNKRSYGGWSSFCYTDRRGSIVTQGSGLDLTHLVMCLRDKAIGTQPPLPSLQTCERRPRSRPPGAARPSSGRCPAQAAAARKVRPNHKEEAQTLYTGKVCSFLITYQNTGALIILQHTQRLWPTFKARSGMCL